MKGYALSLEVFVKKVFSTVIFLLLVLAFPATASAADAVPNSLLVSLWPEYNNNQVFFMQRVELAGNEPLPATVRFSFPSGAQVQWTGEVLGEDVSKDIQATPTVTQKDGYQEVAITLTKSRIGQVETNWNGLKIDGQNRSMVLDWTQRYDTRLTTFEFQQPSQSSDIVMTPQPTGNRKSSEGFTLYQAAPKRIPVGQTATFSITYKRSVTTPSVNDASTSGTEAAAGQTSGTAQNPVSYWMLVLIFVIAGIGGIAYVFWEKSKGDRVGEKDNKSEAASRKKSETAAKKPSSAPNMKAPIIALIIIGVSLGAFALYSFSNVSDVPSGTNCEENAAYLQKGVDEYKKAWGVYPTKLKQLLDSKDGKGPFVETISLKCPSDGTYYAVNNGKIEQSQNTQQP